MEIYAEVERFSFYERPQSIYIYCKVIEKKVYTTDHPNQCELEEVKVNDSISLKTSNEILLKHNLISLEKITETLLSRFLIFEINAWEPAKPNGFNKGTPRFIVKNARKSKCDIFLAN